MEWLETHPPQAQLPLLEAEMITAPLWKAEGKLSGFVFPQLFPVLKGYWLQSCALKETGNNLSLFWFYLPLNPLTWKFSLKAACASGQRGGWARCPSAVWSEVETHLAFRVKMCSLVAAGPW